MGTLHLHYSNRVEQLAGDLAEQLRVPVGGPLDPETVVVQGRGMSVWLAQRLSRALGVWATPMPYPRHFVHDVVERVLGEGVLGNPPLSESTMQWSVHALLPELIGRPELESVRAYLEGSSATRSGRESTDLRYAELSARIATVFDQYLTFRPDWLRAWEAGSDAGIPRAARWQPLVWRAVVNRLGQNHLARLEEPLLASLREGKARRAMPPRISVFGISTLPPLFARVLAALSHQRDVHLYLFAAAPLEQASPSPPSQLATSLGLVGRDFARVITEATAAIGVVPVVHDRFLPPDASTTLGQVQIDLLDPGAAGASRPRPKTLDSGPVQGNLFDLLESAPARLPLTDRASITIHSCHGPMREVEVLHDQLLELLTKSDNPVAPEEVVVLCPDLQTYAPLVEAVFARELSSPRFLPFRISDRASRHEASLVDAFLRVLGMVGGRSTAPEVVDLLVLDAVQRRFGLEPAEVDGLVEQVVKSGIRWGRDAQDRARLGLPASDANTWRFGLRRLLLGYAMPGNDHHDFAGVVPFDEVEGNRAQSVGKLAELVRTLFGWLHTLEQPRRVPEWAEVLGSLLGDLFSPDATTARQVSRIQRAIADLAHEAADAGFEEDVDLATIRSMLERGIDASAPDRGFLAGGITFCAFVPMRSIPFRVICLLGMNDGVFPRSPRPLEIDLIRNGSTPRRSGDRSPRDDDRHLFLETLCAARERLIVTYTGQSVRDNRERPPSVCVSELLDHLGERFSVEGEAASPRRSVARALVVPHRLQGFSHDYFQPESGDPRLFSYAEEYASAANAAEGARREPQSFLRTRLEAPELPQISVDELVRFFQSPATFFLNRRLGVYLREADADVPYREPLELSFLDYWKLGAPLVNYLIEGVTLERAEALFRGHGELPYGALGRLRLETIAESCQAIARATLDARGGAALSPLPVDLTIGSHALVGAVGNRFEGGIVEHTYSKDSARRQIATWIRHVVACATGHAAPSVLVCRDTTDTPTRFAPLPRDAALAILESLVARFAEGQRAPLPFLPAASHAYFTHSEDPQKALERAIKAFGDPDQPGNEASDPHHDRAFDHLPPPFDADFERGARGVEQTRFAELALEVYGLKEGAQ